MGALEEYRRKDAEYKERIQELEVATEARNATRRRHEELRRKVSLLTRCTALLSGSID
jgi:structural maintenance of chromosome 4